ncbi:energy transducer TonB, partial [Rhodovulum iodosum]
AQSGVSGAEARSLRAAWGGAILARVTRAHRYPRAALGQGLTGRALVALEVRRDGRLASARLAESSGSALLDRAALASVRRAGPFPPAPVGLTRASYGFTLPLRFELGN